MPCKGEGLIVAPKIHLNTYTCVSNYFMEDTTLTQHTSLRHLGHLLLATIRVITRALNVAIGPLLTSRVNGGLMEQALVKEAEIF